MTISPGEKLQWLIDHRLLFNTGVQHEVFQLIVEAYPQASEEARRQFISIVLEGRDIQEDLDENLRQYEIYNLLNWLQSKAPDCELAAIGFTQYQTDHPEFTPREYPDLTHWSGSMTGNESPKSVFDLLSMEPADAAAYLISYDETSLFDPNREGLLGVFTGAIQQDYGQSMEIVSALITQEGWKADIWRHAIYGWQNSDLSTGQWREVLSVLTDYNQIYSEHVEHTVANLLYRGLEKKDKGGITRECLDLVEQIADKCWEISVKKKKEQVLSGGEWLDAAINHTGGTVTEVWIKSLVLHRHSAGENWTGIPDEYKKRFLNVLTGQSTSSVMGLVLISSQLILFYSWDKDFAREKILPFFNWDENGERVVQAWDGFLFWGRPREFLLADMLPLYESCYGHLDNFSENARNRFTEHLAVIAVFSSINPIEHGWLSRFLRSTTEDDRIAFAGYIRSHLDDLNDKGVVNLWNSWLDKYWQRRNEGNYAPVSPKEAAEMAEWSPYLKIVFVQAADRLMAGTPPIFDFPRIYHNLQKLVPADEYPDDLARLLDFLLDCEHVQNLFHNCKNVGRMVQSLIPYQSTHSTLVEICNKLLNYGCNNALELSEQIHGQHPTSH